MAIYKHNKTQKEFKPDLSKDMLEQEVVRIKELVDDKTQSIYTKEAFPGDNLQDIIKTMPYGGVIILRNGTHNLGGNHLEMRNGVSLIGESAYGVVLTGTTGVNIFTYSQYLPTYSVTVTATHGSDIITISGGFYYQSLYILLDGLYYRILEEVSPGQFRIEMPYVGNDLSNVNTVVRYIYTSIKFENLTIDGLTIKALYTSELFLKDILFKNTAVGLSAGYISNMSINKCDFVNTGTAIKLDNTHYTEVISTGSINSTGVAFDILNSSNITMSGLFTSSVANYAININSSKAIKIDGSFQYSATALNITNSSDISLNSSILSSNTTAINIDASSRNTISNCSIINNQNAVNIANTSSNDNIISSNIFSNNAVNMTNNGTNTLIRSNIGVADN